MPSKTTPFYFVFQGKFYINTGKRTDFKVPRMMNPVSSAFFGGEGCVCVSLISMVGCLLCGVLGG